MPEMLHPDIQISGFVWDVAGVSEGCITGPDSPVGRDMKPIHMGFKVQYRQADEKVFLQNQAAFLEKQLKEIQERLDGLEQTE